MNIGELFVSLGIEGADKSIADLETLKKGFEGTAMASQNVQTIFSNLGMKGTESTVFGLVGMQHEFERTQKAAEEMNEKIIGEGLTPGDDQLTLLADMRESLSTLAEQSTKTKAALRGVKLKDSEKTEKEGESFKKKLKDISSLSFEAKAAIFGALYALERLFEASGKAGTNLVNFGAITGVSGKVLQQYQYAARQVGVANEEVEGSFKALQSTMTKTLMGEGAPKGLARVAQLTGGLTAQDIQRFAESPQLLLQKLQEYAAKETNAGLRNEVLKSFGITDGMAAALSRQAFKPEILAKAPTYSDQEAKNLDKLRAQIANLETRIEMAVGRFASAHGGQLVSDIGTLVDQVMKLADAFVTLAEKAKIFELVGKIFAGWTSIAKGATEIAGAVQDPKKRDGMERDVADFFLNDIPNLLQSMLPNSGEPAVAPGKRGLSVVPTPRSIAPSIPAGASGKPAQDIKIQQTLNFQHPGTDAQKTGDSVKSAINGAYRQTSAQGQGS